jgi:hypothetical protein
LTPDPAASDGGLLLVLEEQLRREHERIEARRADLATTRDLLSRVTSRALGARARAVEVIEDAHAPSVVSALLADTTGLLRNYVLTVAEGPALDAATMQANVDRIRRGSPQRALYPATVLDAADGGRWMAQWAEVGEEQRVLPTTETEFAVFGSTAVVALAAWDDPSRGYAIIRDPLVIRLYSAYFDLAWASAVPVATLSGEAGVGGVGGRRGRTARRAARARPEGRGDRAPPGGEPAHRAPAHRRAHGGQRGGHALPARSGPGSAAAGSVAVGCGVRGPEA